jgi:glycosyltransferase involved in cell wall biosynthesis
MVRDDLKNPKVQGNYYFGFNTTSLETLEWCREKNITTILDQVDPGRLELEIVLEEARKWEGWDRYHLHMHALYYERTEREWELADQVLVNSEWSRSALITQGVSPQKIMVVPLAFEPPVIHNTVKRGTSENFTVLWFGSVLLRKGIQYLVEAAKLLKDFPIRFLIAGPIGITNEALAQAPVSMKFTGKVSHSLASNYYSNADVFVLPTLSDGFALTQLEAMSYGLPVIATPNCGSVVQEGVNGFIVPPADPSALAARILQLYQQKDLLREMRINAVKRSRAFSLQHYRDSLFSQMITEKQF